MRIFRKTRIFTLKHRHKPAGTGDVVPRQIVGVGVVIYVLRVFIRPDHVMDLQTVANFRRASHPEQRGFHEQRQAFIAHKGVILRCLPVGDNGPRDIRHDMMFSQRGGHFLTNARADVDRCEFWRLFLTARGTLPGEQGARPAVTACFFPGPRQVKPPVAQQTTGNIWSGKEMERQQENFGVPEHVAFIALPGQALGRNTAPFIMGRRHGREVPDRVIQRQLILMFGRRDVHPAVMPDLFPCARRAFE